MPLPKLPSYRKKNSLRPNPHTVDERRGFMKYAQETILIGHFHDDDAAVRPADGLPPEKNGKKKY